MFSWVIKVVPQPPASPGKLGEEDQTNASTAAVSVCLCKCVCSPSRLSQCKHVFTLSILSFRKWRKKRMYNKVTMRSIKFGCSFDQWPTLNHHMTEKEHCSYIFHDVILQMPTLPSQRRRSQRKTGDVFVCVCLEYIQYVRSVSLDAVILTDLITSLLPTLSLSPALRMEFWVGFLMGSTVLSLSQWMPLNWATLKLRYFHDTC